MPMYSVRHSLNFNLDDNWSMTIENKGSAVVKYTATRNDALIWIEFGVMATSNTVRIEPARFSKGDEILIIGSYVYLPKTNLPCAGNPDWSQIGRYQQA